MAGPGRCRVVAAIPRGISSAAATLASEVASDPLMNMRSILLLVAFLLLLLACGEVVNGNGVPQAGDPDDAAGLEAALIGTEWASTQVEGFDLPSDAPIRLRFVDPTTADVGFAAEIDCTSMESPFTIEHGRFIADPETFSHTTIECDAQDRAADDWLFELLTSQPQINRDAHTLTVTGAESSVVFDAESRPVADAVEATPEETPSVSSEGGVVDGQLDCTDDIRFETTHDYTSDANGPDTPEEALEAYIGRYVQEGDAVHIDGDTGTVVRDGREVVRVTAGALPAGGWGISEEQGCAGAEADESSVAHNCAGVPFVPEAVLGQSTPAETREGEVYDALRFHLEEGTAFGDYPAGPWYELGSADAQTQFFAEYDPPLPDAPLGVYMALEQRDGAWEWAGAGDCRPTAHHPTLGPATWALEGSELGPEDTAFTASVTERSCASGQSSEGRVRDPLIVYTDEAVIVTFFMEPLDGGQNCPGNPPTAVDVQLDEPLGDRSLLDGGVWPPREPVAE